jgi:hypothetical protein
MSVYKKGFVFPLLRKNINCSTDIMWEQRKELKLCSSIALEWAGHLYAEIKIQEEIDHAYLPRSGELW